MHMSPLLIGSISLVISILSPAISALITTRHERKMYSLKFYEQHRAEIIEGYIRTCGAVLSNPTIDNLSDFGKFSGELFFYVPNELYELVRNLNCLIRSREYDAANELFNTLCTALTKNPPRLKKI